MKKTLFVLIYLHFQIISNAQTIDSTVYELPTVNLINFYGNDSILSVPASISLIDQQTIQSNNSVEIAAVLNKMPGIFMQSGSINTNRISIRGMGARTPYGTNKIRGFYGNIPLTSGDSETTIEDLDMEMMQEIQIIKGPMSSIYGAGLGGAILIEPRQSISKGNEFRFTTTIGSFGLMRNSAAYNWTGKTSSLNYAYSRIDSEGFRQNSDYFREGHTLSGNIFKNGKHQLAYLFNQIYLKAHIASSVSEDDFVNNPQNAAANWLAAKGFEQYHSYMGGLDYSYKINSKLNWGTAVYFNIKDAYEPRPFDILSQQNEAFGARTQFSANDLWSQSISFIFGAEIFKDNYAGQTFENLYEQNNGNGSLQGNQLTETLQDRFFYNLFVQLKFKFLNQFEFQAGLNFNHTQFKLTNSFPIETYSGQPYQYDPILAPQFSILYYPDSDQTIYLSASRGYSMPSIDEMLNEEGRLNPQIKPENGYNFELGYKILSRNKRLQLQFSAYRMIVEDLLVSQRVAEDQYIGVNAGKTLHQGLELFTQYKIPFAQNRWIITPFLSATFGQFEFKEFVYNEDNFTGNELTGIPSTQITSGFVLEMPHGFSWNLDYYFIEKFPINDANTVYNDNYHLLNTKISWQYSLLDNFNLGLAFGINNLTDTHYASQVLVNATGFGNTQPRYYYPGNPVNLYGQINLRFRL